MKTLLFAVLLVIISGAVSAHDCRPAVNPTPILSSYSTTKVWDPLKPHPSATTWNDPVPFVYPVGTYRTPTWLVTNPMQYSWETPQ